MRSKLRLWNIQIITNFLLMLQLRNKTSVRLYPIDYSVLAIRQSFHKKDPWFRHVGLFRSLFL